MFKTPLFAPSVIVIASWTLGTAAPAPGQTDKLEADRLRAARKFADAMAAGRFEDAVSGFDQTMARLMPADKLEEFWKSLAASAGAFESFGEPTAGSVGRHRVVYVPVRFKNAALRLQITVDDDLHIGGLYVVPAEPIAPYEPPAYDKSDRYTERDVEFGESPWTVKGKLTVPASGGPHRAVVLVHGSGPHDEDETIGPNKPFRDLAGGLSSNGIAVLRYQKRTFAHRAAVVERGAITVREEVIDDALSAIRFLRGQAGTDSKHVYLLGHSLGATLAPHVAREDGRLAGVILLSGTPRDFYDVVAEQLDYIASLPGPQQDGNRKARDEARAVIERIRAGKAPPDASLLGAPAAYWNELNGLTAKSTGILAGLPGRILIAGGGRDYQVTREDFNMYKAALKKRSDAALKWYPSLNHLFATGKGKATPSEYGKPGHVDQKVITDLVAWIQKG